MVGGQIAGEQREHCAASRLSYTQGCTLPPFSDVMKARLAHAPFAVSCTDFAAEFRLQDCKRLLNVQQQHTAQESSANVAA